MRPWPWHFEVVSRTTDGRVQERDRLEAAGAVARIVPATRVSRHRRAVGRRPGPLDPVACPST
jgi:hypothetical protein